ncbi:MAG: adenylyltransferase/cytidyltransferase family protein [Coriobacteriales bacterium]|jgi:glycerol-3-phosphate cytidylyltransferase|nr:adenylyltransferase/cytidyltransferase family protein [Coriobacteriales bacterium]
MTHTPSIDPSKDAAPTAFSPSTPGGAEQPRRVLTYGTFDTFHWGHINLLRRAKDLAFGGSLVVALSTDEFNAVKGKWAYHDFETRWKMLSAIRYVDQIIPERDWGQKLDDVKAHLIDCVVMGADWEGDEHFEVLRGHCELVFLSRTESISSTRIREILGAEGL